MPCSWLGVVKNGKSIKLQWFQQVDNDTITIDINPKKGKLWLMLDGDYDNDCAQYKYSLNCSDFISAGNKMTLSYQLITFQGSRPCLFAFNSKGKRGGYARFDNFKGIEPKADRKTFLGARLSASSTLQPIFLPKPLAMVCSMTQAVATTVLLPTSVLSTRVMASSSFNVPTADISWLQASACQAMLE